MRNALKRMAPLWDHRFHVRAFGPCVVATAEQHGLFCNLERTLTVKLGESGEAMIYGTRQTS